MLLCAKHGRGISSTGTRLTERKVEKRDGNEIRATAAGWGNGGGGGEIDEEDDDFFSSPEEGGRKLDGFSLASLVEQLSQLEVGQYLLFACSSAYGSRPVRQKHSPPQCPRSV